MRYRLFLTATVFLLAAAAPWAERNPVFSQKRRVVVGGRPAQDPAPEPTPLPMVEAIDPTPEEAADIERLIEQLGAPRLEERDRAMAAVARFGARALGQVREARLHDDDEIAHRCKLLEEVLQSGEAELFLAARRLDLTLAELNDRLNSEDVTPLLEILKSRAKAGLGPLWARVLVKLAGRPTRYPAAELCLEIEGAEGYGEALVLAAGSNPGRDAAEGLIRLIRFIPPKSAEAALTVLSVRVPENTTAAPISTFRGRFDGDEAEPSAPVAPAAPSTQPLPAAFELARDLRGFYAAEDCTAALENEQSLDETLLAIGLAMCPAAGQPLLERLAVLAGNAPSPKVWVSWVGLLARSDAPSRLRGLLDTADSEFRQATAAEAWARSVSVQEGIDAWEDLSHVARLGTLRSWALEPHDAETLQPFLLSLLRGAGRCRKEAAKLLGGYRAPSTAKALAEAATDPALAPVALESLAPMADLLPDGAETALADLRGRLTNETPADARAGLQRVLANAGDDASLRALHDFWKSGLTLADLPAAVPALAARFSETPAGLYCAGQLLGARAQGLGLDQFLYSRLTPTDLGLIRLLLDLPEEDGFLLLSDIAGRPGHAQRADAALALVAGDREGDRIQDWLRRASGEDPDPDPRSLRLAVALSAAPEGDDFRRRSLRAGEESDAFFFSAAAILAGRGGELTLDELLDALEAHPAALARLGDLLRRALEAPQGEEQAGRFSTLLLRHYAAGGDALQNQAIGLFLAANDIDPLPVLYGTGEVRPRDDRQLAAAALLGDAERMRPFLESIETAADGSNYEAVCVARAWLGLGPDRQRAVWLRSVDDVAGRSGALLRLHRLVEEGDAAAMRRVLDLHGGASAVFESRGFARIQLTSNDWGDRDVLAEGAAAGFGGLATEVPPCPFVLWSLVPGASSSEDRLDAWACRRALLEAAPDGRGFRFVELP